MPHLVVLGSSAGGLQALSTVLSELPQEIPAALLIVQHISADHVSHLAEILSRQTGFPVEQAREGASIQTGRAYTAQPDQHLTIDAAGCIRLLGGERIRFSRPSIDALFSSAAVAFGSRVIAVVLTGGGSDGTEGARLVREHKGTVIVQSQRSAAHPHMPGSVINRGHATHVVPLEKIAQRIMESITSAQS